MGGGSLGALLGLGRHGALLLDTRFERGQERLPLGEVRWSLLSGFAGGALHARVGVLRPALALGVRAGWLALAAEAPAPNEGRSLTAPWAGVALPVRLGAEVGSRLTPFLAGEAGYVLVPVSGRVDDGSVLSSTAESGSRRAPAWRSGSEGRRVTSRARGCREVAS